MGNSISRACAGFLVAGGLTLAQAGTGPFVLSTFDSDNEGWGIVTLESNVSLPPYASYEPDYHTEEGLSGGYISEVDPDGRSFFFDAPEQFLGDISIAYGHALVFDLRTSQDNTSFITDVVLEGAGVTIICPFNDPLPGVWTHYEIPLNPTGGWLKMNGHFPTANEMMAVMEDVTALRIRGEFYNGNTDRSDLDNVALWSTCNCPADLDQDCDVDVGDITILLTHFGALKGMNPRDGDLDGDGGVGIMDLAMLLARFDQSCF